MGRPLGSKNKLTPKEALADTTTVMTDEDFVDPDDMKAHEAMFGGASQPQHVDGDAPVTQNQLAQTTEQLAKAVHAMIDGQPIKRVPWAKFKTRSPFNPTGNRRRKLNRRFYQNGRRMNVTLLHDAEIALLNQLTPGKFIGNRVTVVEIINGGNTDVNIVYKTKGIDQQLENKTNWRTLEELLRKCVDEAGQTASV